MRVLIVEDEPYMAEAIRDGLRLEAIAADITGDGGTALELLRVNAYDIAVLDRDIPGPSGDEDPGIPTGCCSCGLAVGHAAIQGSVVLPARIRFSICRRHAAARSIRACAC